MSSVRVAFVQVLLAATAAMLAFQPTLGAPALDLAGIKLHAPWKLFAWWLISAPR